MAIMKVYYKQHDDGLMVEQVTQLEGAIARYRLT